ncbi:SNF2 family N-terminal domain-containing protein [Lasiosphaeris hirsuta]|uniref:SNF2 family N-terminal domain-containing protein n=1 Tax=Lasiosphaeris hirsuta TaxID=260670 RepID=A0AA40AG93_9PEZI|nr:SNF2 family N-terminal domain-containing protein [Lasiosphaeris hirsuta]
MPRSGKSYFGRWRTPSIANIEKINTTSSSSFSGPRAAPIFALVYGKILKLTFSDSGKYAGILNSPVLCSLPQDFKVRFSARLLPPDREPEPKPGKQQLKLPKLCPVRIVIYAMRGDEGVIGHKLSDAGLFLQHPAAHECNSESVRYSNPHYLARPGSEPPKLEEWSLTTNGSSPSKADRLDEVGMSRLLRIFDFAESDGSGVSVTVDPNARLSSTLMSHQLVALAMMIEKECGIVDNPRSSLRWREMGLGKTLSVLALICSSLDEHHRHPESEHECSLQGTLIITPKSSKASAAPIANRRRLELVQLASQLQHLDVVITTYATLRFDWEANGPFFTQKWLRVVLDEAHHIRNRSSLAFKAAMGLQANYRWCLSGTPIHNSLDDYGALLAFVGVEPFHDKAMFDYWIASPLKDDPPVGIRRLKDLVRATCLRRTKTSPAVHLDLLEPIRNIEYVNLSDEDQALYDFFRKKTADIAVNNHTAKHVRGNTAFEGNILSHMNVLRLICNHGKALLPPQALTAWLEGSSTETDLQIGAVFQADCSLCGVDIGAPDDNIPSFPSLAAGHGYSLCETCYSTNEVFSESKSSATKKKKNKQGGERVASVMESSQPSAKVEALLKNLFKKQNADIEGLAAANKSVIFSSWTRMLDLVGSTLRRRRLGLQRIDGGTSIDARREALRHFNAHDGFAVMLASIGSCGEGVDFTAANNVHIMEPHWSRMFEKHHQLVLIESA